MTRECEDIEGGGGALKIFRHPKWGSEKIVGLGREAPEIILYTSKLPGEGEGDS